MKNSYKLPAIIFLCFIIASCKKVIDLKLDDAPQQLIIEGNITDIAGPQTVTISKSISFSSTNNYPAVTGALVKVTDQTGHAYNFTERAPGTYSINSFLSKYNQTYTLQVQTDGKTYTANSTMPNRVMLDSLTLTAQTFGRSTTETVAVNYKDPAGVANQYRFIIRVNDVQVKDIFVRNDQFSDGRQVQALLYQNDITLKSGDNVTVEMQSIDQVIYNYWYTFSLQQDNGFTSTTPTNPPNNFTGSVLGYFSAHTVQRKNLVIP